MRKNSKMLQRRRRRQTEIRRLIDAVEDFIRELNNNPIYQTSRDFEYPTPPPTPPPSPM
jgi:hypothetical protein